ncbi:MAG: group II intron reverse transcriptase/maturase [Planctomycetes bacterium]|nr:group II intron reverse transcriptase/maturase [Planctomycetota bacterium]
MAKGQVWLPFEEPKTDRLLEPIASWGNLLRAWAAVRRNRGAPGIDGVTIDRFEENLESNLRELQADMVAGRYRHQPLRRVWIPKPGSDAKRPLGIPAIRDRVAQQALLYVIEPLYEGSFSESSYGFRPGRSQHQAVEQALKHIAAGHRWVVDVDLKSFFDTIPHWKMVARCRDRIADERVITILARMLKSGVIQEGRWTATQEVAPQGGPLSPLLSNIVLHQLDQELEARGHRFVRYADDFQIFKTTWRAAYRVMDRVVGFLEKRMHLTVNREKSSVCYCEEATFLGFRYACPMTQEQKDRPGGVYVVLSEKAKSRFKQRVRELTPRNAGRSIRALIADLSTYVRGWVGYYGIARDYFFRNMMSWIRRRLRAIKLKQWGCRKAVRKALIRAGVAPARAAEMALSHFGWRAAASPAAHMALRNRWFTKRGLYDLTGCTTSPGVS